MAAGGTHSANAALDCCGAAAAAAELPDRQPQHPPPDQPQRAYSPQPVTGAQLGGCSAPALRWGCAVPALLAVHSAVVGLGRGPPADARYSPCSLTAFAFLCSVNPLACRSMQSRVNSNYVVALGCLPSLQTLALHETRVKPFAGEPERTCHEQTSLGLLSAGQPTSVSLCTPRCPTRLQRCS